MKNVNKVTGRRFEIQLIHLITNNHLKTRWLFVFAYSWYGICVNIHNTKPQYNAT
jgi:hypothetical protein